MANCQYAHMALAGFSAQLLVMGSCFFYYASMAKWFSFIFAVCILILCSVNAATLVAQSSTSTISIATFNIRILSDRSRDDVELREIAELIEDFDIVAIQEVRDVRILERLIRMLKSEFRKDYLFDASPPAGRSVKELYAFVWRSDRIQATSLTALVSDPDDTFIREPAWQRFVAIDGGFDFVLISFHAVFGDNRVGREREAVSLVGVMNEVETIVQRDDATEGDFILLGDFNLSCENTAFDGLRQMGMVAANPGLGTTIFDSPYDNIWYFAKASSEYTREWGMIKFDETEFDNNDAIASLAVSDHRPLWAKFYSGDDDD